MVEQNNNVTIVPDEPKISPISDEKTNKYFTANKYKKYIILILGEVLVIILIGSIFFSNYRRNESNNKIALVTTIPIIVSPTEEPGITQIPINTQVPTNPLPSPQATINNEDKSCFIKDFKMAFILVGLNAEDITPERLAIMDLMKTNLANAFSVATKGLATMDTSFPTVTLINGIDGNMVFFPGEEIQQVADQEVAIAFYKKYPDDFHFISIFQTFENHLSQMHKSVQNRIKGINHPGGIFNDSYSYDSQGKLLGINIIQGGNIDGYGNGRVQSLAGVGILLHETGHQWCCYIGTDFISDKSAQLPILMNNRIHYYYGFSTTDDEGDPLWAHKWVDNGDDTYSMLNNMNEMETIERYHQFTLYQMGLIDESEITEAFPLFDASYYPDWNFNTARFVKNIYINDLIKVAGELSCSNE